MSATTSTLEMGTVSVPQTRRRVLGFIFLGVAAFIWLVFLRAVDPMMDTTMRLYPGGSTVVVDDWVFNTQAMLWVMAAGCAAVGSFQLVRGFGRRTGLAFGVVGGMFVFAFLSWAASGGTLNLAGMLRIMVVRSVPLTLGALSGILCERAGVFNIAIEGMMLTAAMIGTIVGSVSTLWIGLLGAILAGGLLGLVHAILSIRYRTDQIISGTVINIFAVGITSFISGKFMQPMPQFNDPGIFVPYEIPLLSQIPVLGPVLFRQNVFVYGMFFFVAFLSFMLFKNSLGIAASGRGRAPQGGRHPGRQCDPDPLHGCHPGRDDGRVRRRLLHPGLGGQVRPGDDGRTRIHRPGGDDLRELHAGGGNDCRAAVRLLQLPGGQPGGAAGEDPVRIPADDALPDHHARAGGGRRPGTDTGGGGQTVR